MAGVADAVIVAAWAAVAGHNVVLAARGVRRGRDARRWALGVVLAVAVIGAGIVLERRSGRLDAPPVVVALGLVAAVAGALLHLGARRALGAEWSSRPEAGERLIERGPYGIVRHPLYLGLGLLAAGSMAVHPSVPTLAGGMGLLAGLAFKIVAEERALAATFGSDWEAYRRRVPRLTPWMRRRS